MPLVLKLAISKNNSQVIVSDISGLYDLTNNPTGWGVPNIEYTDVISATLNISNFYNESSETFSLNYPIQTPAEIIQFGPFVDTFGDGILKADLVLTTATEEYKVCISSFFMLDVDCCVDKYLVDALEYDNLNDPIFIRNIMQAEAIRRALKSSAYSISKSKIKYFLDQLNKICKLCACAE